MGHLANFKRQHREIRELVKTIKSLLSHEFLHNDPAQARYKLSALSGKLLMHLSMEDQYLYPSLTGQDNPHIRAVAEQFFQEMGDLFDTFKKYSQKWSRPSLIQADPQAFIDDSKQIFDVLLHRIEREDRELYPLAEELI